MSCIAGLAGFPDVVPAMDCLARMLDDMADRAPHGRASRAVGPVALGQAVLATSARDQAPTWPLTLDGHHWIVADARIDGRAELLAGLRSRGREVRDDAPHAELILQAYCAFGDAFLTRLIGDFSFALWDGVARRLICARDHFGVRPFLYTRHEGQLAFASDTGALLGVPWVSGALDEVSLVDFLMFGAPVDDDRSAFLGVQSLPPAGRLVWEAGTLRVDRYWTLPPEGDPRGWQMGSLAQELLDAFTHAVKDRLPDGPVGAELSGGMDSSAITALAVRHAPAGKSGVFAYTHDLSRLEPRDEEGRLAGQIAHDLGISWVCQDMSRFRLFGPLGGQMQVPREPLAYPLLEAHRENLAHATSRGVHVMLSGEFGDAVLTPDTRYASRLRAQGRWARMAAEALRHLVLTGGLAGLGLRSALLTRAVPEPWEPLQPGWIRTPRPGAVDPARRWRMGWDQLSADLSARSQLGRSWVGRSSATAECLRLPIVFRYPFLDLRVVNIALQMPTGALAGKRVLRRAMQGWLPANILARPKSSAPGDYMRSLARREDTRYSPVLSPEMGAAADAIDPHVWREQWHDWLAGAGLESTWSSHLLLAPRALEWWIIGGSKETADAGSGFL